MAFRLTPHERAFYPLFTRAAENIAGAADLLATLVAAEPDGRPAVARLVKSPRWPATSSRTRSW